MVKREVRKQTLLKEEKKVKGIYGYLKLKNGKEYDLEGQIPPKFNYNDIISFGQEEVGDEAENYIKYTDGSSESLTNLKDIKLFYKKLFENKIKLKESVEDATILNPEIIKKGDKVIATNERYTYYGKFQLLSDFKEDKDTDKDFYVAFAKNLKTNKLTTVSGYFNEELKIDGSEFDGFSGNYLGEDEVEKLKKKYKLEIND